MVNSVSHMELGFHFPKFGNTINYDGAGLPKGTALKEGTTLSVKGNIVPCVNGLHGSPNLRIAIDFYTSYGGDLTLCHFEGNVTFEGDRKNANKFAARNRTVLKIVTRKQLFAYLRKAHKEVHKLKALPTVSATVAKYDPYKQVGRRKDSVQQLTVAEEAVFQLMRRANSDVLLKIEEYIVKSVPKNLATKYLEFDT